MSTDYLGTEIDTQVHIKTIQCMLDLKAQSLVNITL